MNKVIYKVAFLVCLTVLLSCKKGKDPATITIKIEATCAYTVTYNIYYGANYNPYAFVGVGNSEKYFKMYDGDHIIIKAYKNSAGMDSNPVKVSLLNGVSVLGSNSSSVDGAEISLDYTY